MACFVYCLFAPARITPGLPPSLRDGLHPPQGAIRKLLRELRAAASPVGPAPQRLAHYFANALASRVLGDGAQRYAAEVPQNAQVNAQ